jgi:carboxymethylenebutenolidase
MDALGLRPAMDAVAAPLVDAGYVVLQPDLYARCPLAAPFDPVTLWTDPPERARLGVHLAAVRPAEVVADTRAWLAALAGDPRIAPGPIGLIGYCLGGRMALCVASALGDAVGAAVCVHAGGLVTDAPDSPHRSVDRIRGQVWVASAGADPGFTDDHRAALAVALEAAGVRHGIQHDPAVRHGFAVPDFPVYAPAAADAVRRAALATFASALGPAAPSAAR